MKKNTHNIFRIILLAIFCSLMNVASAKKYPEQAVPNSFFLCAVKDAGCGLQSYQFIPLENQLTTESLGEVLSKGYLVKKISYTQAGWFVLYEKGLPYTDQKVYSIEGDFPQTFLDGLKSKGEYVVTMAGYDNHWRIATGKTDAIEDQVYQAGKLNPTKKWIKEKLALGYHVQDNHFYFFDTWSGPFCHFAVLTKWKGNDSKEEFMDMVATQYDPKIRKKLDVGYELVNYMTHHAWGYGIVDPVGTTPIQHAYISGYDSIPQKIEKLWNNGYSIVCCDAGYHNKEMEAKSKQNSLNAGMAILSNLQNTLQQASQNRSSGSSTSSRNSTGSSVASASSGTNDGGGENTEETSSQSKCNACGGKGYHVIERDIASSDIHKDHTYETCGECGKRYKSCERSHKHETCSACGGSGKL